MSVPDRLNATAFSVLGQGVPRSDLAGDLAGLAAPTRGRWPRPGGLAAVAPRPVAVLRRLRSRTAVAAPAPEGAAA